MLHRKGGRLSLEPTHENSLASEFVLWVFIFKNVSFLHADSVAAHVAIEAASSVGTQRRPSTRTY